MDLKIYLYSLNPIAIFLDKISVSRLTPRAKGDLTPTSQIGESM